MKDIHKHVRDPKLKAELKECSGIGTEATRAGIIEEIQKKGFLVLSKKFLVPTDIGKMIVKILPPELTYPDTTAIWEEKLSAVEKGELSYEEFERGQVAVLEEFLAQAKSLKLAPPANVPLCPNCGKAMVRRQNTKNKGEYFWSCSGYPDCKTTAQDVNGKILFDKDAPKCPKCGKPMHRRQSTKNKGEFFWSCTGYPDCKTSAPDAKGKPDFKTVEQRAGRIDRQSDSVPCPDCGKPMIRRKSAKGNYWWGCTGYPDCKTTAFDENGKPKFK